MFATHHVELLLEFDGEGRAMEGRRKHVVGVFDQAQIVVRRGHFKQMEPVLLQSVGFVAGEHHVYRQTLALRECLDRLGRGIVQLDGINSVVEDVRLMDKRLGRDGIIDPGVKQQSRIEHLFHVLLHQWLQVFLRGQLAHANRMVIRQQFGVMFGERLVIFLVEYMTAHAGCVGDLASLMHETQQVGVGIVPCVRVTNLVATGYERVVPSVQYLQLFDGFVELRREPQCLVL